ncbi:MAG: 3-oxoacyl-ACP reductase FabG [Dehalococcoidia bacterium]|nr:3-oxoacyl-ACP reductase FabG [Dehalococcoidia bacterium]
MAGRLEGKVAIVTGAGRGIGRGEALALSEEGAAVVVNDLGGSTGGEGADQTPAEEVVNEIKKNGGKAVANYADVSNYDACEAMVKQALDEFGRLDILVNNAGILRDRMVFNMSEAEWDIVVAVHMKGTFNTIKHASIVFRQQRSGRIINTGSSSGLGNAGQANYAAAKAGVSGMSRALARELGSRSITVNCVAPGFIDTDMTKALPDAQRDALLGQIPLGRLGQADEVAAAVAFLASPRAAYITGTTIHVNGGMYMS